MAAGAPLEMVPAGLACRDSLRLEAAMPLYGNELGLAGDPFSAGLGRSVGLVKEGDFVGKAALASMAAGGVGITSGRALVGLRAKGRRAARAHYAVESAGVTVGEVTSGIPSPTLGYPIALAYVDVAWREIGTVVDVDIRGSSEPFEVVATPFYRRAES